MVALKGVCKVFLGDPESAKQLIDKALRLAPGDAQVNLNAAIIWSALGHKARAKEYAEEAQSLGYPESVLLAHPDITWTGDGGTQRMQKGGSHKG